jgi:predicted nucleic acid-binding protein
MYGFMSSQNMEKHLIAKELIERDDVVVSQQVVAELCNALIRKAKTPEAEIRRIIAYFKAKYNPLVLDTEHYLLASRLRERYNFSHWDSLLIISAIELGASVFYSEDMQDGLVVDGTLTIRHPFL